MNRAETLLDDFNLYRFHTASLRNSRFGGGRVYLVGKSGKARAQWLAVFEAMADWCSKRDIDPRGWLHYLFEIRHWAFAPRQNQLISPKRVAEFKARSKPNRSLLLQQSRQRERQEAAVDDGRVFDARRDLSHSAEALKVYFSRLGQHGRCMAAMESETYGYHPLSRVCPTCPIGAACEAQLRAKTGFDIQALRRGELTLQQAATLGAYHGGRQ